MRSGMRNEDKLIILLVFCVLQVTVLVSATAIVTATSTASERASPAPPLAHHSCFPVEGIKTR